MHEYIIYRETPVSFDPLLKRTTYFFSVTVAPEPPEIVLESVSQTVIEGEEVEFRCNASGIPTPSIIWERLGSKLPDGALDRNGLLTIASVGAEDSGTYTCKAVNSEGEDRFNVQLKVIGKCERLRSSHGHTQGPRHALVLRGTKLETPSS